MNANIELFRNSSVCEGIEDADGTQMPTNVRPLEATPNSGLEQIHARVTNVLAEALVVDRKRVTPTAALKRELGADSLDLLEVIFHLEQEFDIEIPRDELFPESIFRIDPKWVLDGKLTDIGLAELRSRLLSSYKNDRRMSSVPDLITVDLVAKYVAWKLGGCAGTNGSLLKLVPTTQGGESHMVTDCDNRTIPL
jgi:acyl carrier protein